MRAAHTVVQIRQAEAAAMAGLSDGALMSRAAFGLATATIEFLGGCYGRRVLLLVGSGDNGRDALLAGEILARRGALVRAISLSVATPPVRTMQLHRLESKMGEIGLLTMQLHRSEGVGLALSVSGALSGFAGMVRYDGDASAAVIARFPEVLPGAGRVQAWVTGCGGGLGAADALARCLADPVPVVVDADAIAHLPRADRGAQPAVVLTPHAGELAALMGVERTEVEARQLHWAQLAATQFDAVVVLKGRRTVIASPDGTTRVNTAGTPWLASAGAGDVLAGLIGSLLAAGLTPFDAASSGAWLHGAAATQLSAGGGLRTAELGAAIREVASDLLSKV